MKGLFQWGCPKSDMKGLAFSSKHQLFSFLCRLSQHEKLNISPGSNSGYPKTSWPASWWQKLLQASISSHSNPNHPSSQNIQLSVFPHCRAPTTPAATFWSLWRSTLLSKSSGSLLSSHFTSPLAPAVFPKQRECRAKPHADQKPTVQAPRSTACQNSWYSCTSA